ncbi:hypothetical protein MMC16_005409 [Acarospora aff. strigata]|nr:hypothetical protein [Acarospora aff. strigata]
MVHTISSEISWIEDQMGFSSPWVRIAWLKTVQEQRPKLDMLCAIASINEQPCPGKVGAIRAWHRLHDSETGKPISNFDNHTQQRACDLRSDSKRFAGYVDRLDAIANKADAERRPPRMGLFVDYARNMANTRECSKDDMVLHQAWHIMPQIPQFTVCEECYDEVVWPAIDAGSPLAAKFNRSMQIVGPGGVSCQLYSPRTRRVFRDAVRNNDLAFLQEHVVKRFDVERDLHARSARARAYDDGEEIARIAQEWEKWE